MMKDMLERETGLPLLGCLPRLEECAIESRHLGLVTAAEIQGLQEKIRQLGDAAEENIDIDCLLKIASSAQPVSGCLPTATQDFKEHPRIAIARDEAFCFYYEDNLNLLEKLGAVLVPFSPLHDKALPEGTHALYLGGGYPELYAKALSENTPMLECIRNAVSAGLPTFAECGGYLYLLEELEDDTVVSYPMAGAIKGRGYKTSALQRFGYITLTAREDNLLCAAGESIPSHEFHYWDSTVTDGSCTARKLTGQEWPCIIANNTLFAGFPHLYFYGNPKFAENFVKAAVGCAKKTFNHCRERS
jgi:cobyrinic acid a,c-diamide synthase